MSISSMIRKINSEACLRFKMFMLKHKILRVFLFSFFYSSTPQKGKKSGEKKNRSLEIVSKILPKCLATSRGSQNTDI